MEQHVDPSRPFSAELIERNGWKEVVLCDRLTGTSATIIPSAGAILNQFEVMHQGQLLNIIDGLKDADDWKMNFTHGFKSAKLSPFVCRLHRSSYTWEGKRYTADKFLLNGHAIHGLVYDAVHEIEFLTASAFMAECKFFYRYTGDYPGYPFAFDMNIRYRLEDSNRLTITTTVHNRSEYVIPIADGWHPYFKLGTTIDTATLQINSREQIEFNQELLPTGNVLRDEKWHTARSLKGEKLDNCFKLKMDEPLPHCTFRDETVGLQLFIYPESGYPYLQVYTPDHRKSIALENLSSPPDSFNNQIGLIKLGPLDSHTFSTRFRIASTSEINDGQ